MKGTFFITNGIDIDCLSDADIKDLIKELKDELEDRKNEKIAELWNDFLAAWIKLQEEGIAVSYFEEGTREVVLINLDNFSWFQDN